MTSEKKIVPVIRICNCGGKLSQKWFIYWKEGKKRIRKYKGINENKTRSERLEAAKKLKLYWEQQLATRVEGFGKSEYSKQYKKINRFIATKRGAWRETTARQVDSRIILFFVM